MRYGVASRLPGKTLQAGTTRTSSKSSSSTNGQQRDRPNSAALVSPRHSINNNTNDLSYNNLDHHNNSYSMGAVGGLANGSRASSVGRSSVARSNTPGVLFNSSHVRSSGYGHGSVGTNNNNSPSVPKSTQAALDEFSKPTAASEARNATASVLVERLRNIVSKHDERVGNNTNNNGGENNNSNTFTSTNSRQFEALKQHRANSSMYGNHTSSSVQRGLDFENGNNNNNNSAASSSSGAVPNESKFYSNNSNRMMIGSYLDDNNNASNHTTPVTSAPGSAMKPAFSQQQQNQQQEKNNWRGGMEYSDDDEDDEEYWDEEEEDEDEERNQKKQRIASISPQRPPLPQTPGTSPNPRLSPSHQTNANNNNNSPTGGGGVATRQIAGFSWCRDWTRRGMRPNEVTFNEQNRVALEASTHVEPRGLDIWHFVAQKQKSALAPPTTSRSGIAEQQQQKEEETCGGSFLCRRCGIPVFPATAMTYPIPRAGHVTFTHRFGRTTEAELCPQEGKIIMKCARCHGFLADIYDVQSRSIPPLFRASSWCLWYDPEMNVPQNLGETLGPYIEEVEDGMDESELQEMLDRVDPLTEASDFF